MTRFFYTLFIIISFISCNNKSNNTDSTSPTDNKSSNAKQNEFWQKLVMNEVPDGKGGVAAIIPLPADWKLNTNGVSISGPNGIKVTDFPAHSFMINYNQSLQYAYANTQMRALPSIEQLIQEDFIPAMASKGYEYIKSYEIPEISKMDKWYSDQLFKAMPSTTIAKAFGSDWKDKSGKLFFLLIHVNASETQDMQNWYYMSSLLEADDDVFESAKKSYIFALSNMRYNLEPIMAYNREEAQRVGQNWSAFNQRMAANQAAFESSQRAHVNKSEAINAAIMSGWKSSNAASDKNHEQFIDMIREETNVQNNETGTTYKVQEGTNQYWMNSNGEYIGSNQQNYNPNLDENMNEQKWQELQRIK